MEFENLKKANAEIASLRARGFHRDAIELVKATVPKLADKTDCVALLAQGLYAAQDLKDGAEAHMFASEILAVDPGFPSAKKALGLS